MKRGIDPMPMFIAAMLSPSVIAKLGNKLGNALSSVNDHLSQPSGLMHNAKKEEMDKANTPTITLPSISVLSNDNMTLPGFYQSST